MGVNPIVWLHEAALRADHPAMRAAGPHATAVHVWDDAQLQRAGYSLKRLVFIYECIAALNITLLRGDTVAVLSALKPDPLYVPACSAPWLEPAIAALQAANVSVMRVADVPFVPEKRGHDPKRFFQYWQRAEKYAFTPATETLPL